MIVMVVIMFLMIVFVWDVLFDFDVVLLLVVEVELVELEFDFDMLFKWMFGGRVEMVVVGCVLIFLLLIKIIVLLLGMLDIVMNNKFGLGWNKFGLGGSWVMWRDIELFWFMVKVLFSCIDCCFMFILCVVYLGWMS